MRLVLGVNPFADEGEVLRQAKISLAPSLYSSYESAVRRFFRDSTPASEGLLERVQEVAWELNEACVGARTGKGRFMLYGSRGVNKTLLPKLRSLRPEPDLWGWIRVREDYRKEDLYHCIGHELWHIVFELTYDSWKQAVNEKRVFPLWLLQQAAIMNYPFQEMVCDMGAELIAESIGKTPATKMVKFLRNKNPLAYADFVNLMGAVLDEFRGSEPGSLPAGSSFRERFEAVYVFPSKSTPTIMGEMMPRRADSDKPIDEEIVDAIPD